MNLTGRTHRFTGRVFLYELQLCKVLTAGNKLVGAMLCRTNYTPLILLYFTPNNYSLYSTSLN